MFIKRMINDYEKSIKDAENGSKGGNPLLTRVNPEEEEEEKNKIKTPTPKGARKPKPETAIPKELDTAKFREAWSDWQRYRAESRKKLTPSTIEKQLASLSKMGEPRAIAAINNSIQQGYQGIFEASGGGSGGGGGKINRNAHLKIEPDAAESWRD